MPLLNEARVLDEVMQSLQDQDYPGDWELVAVDGGSSDDTVAILRSWQERMARLVVVPAPEGSGNLTGSLNLAVRSASGKVAVRADAHTLYESDYLRRNVEVLEETGADLVGGPMRPMGVTAFGRAVASAMANPWVVGPAPFRQAGARRPADTVYLGAMRRSRLLELGFRRLPTGVAEDADLAYRLRKQGGKVILDHAIRSLYRSRSTPTGLWRQFYRYGKGKAEMLYANREFPSLRPIAPLMLVGGLGLAASALPLFGWWWPLPLLAAVWLGYLGLATAGRPLTWAAAAIMQLANGSGIATGLLRGPRRVRSFTG